MSAWEGLPAAASASPRRALAWLLVAAVVVTAAVRAVPAFRSVHDEVIASRAGTALERKIRSVKPVDLDQRLLFTAQQVIPEHATYALITGNLVSVSSPVVFDAIGPYAAYWLLPRRKTADAKHAEWIISYGGDLDSLGLRYQRVITIERGLSIAEVVR